MSTRERMLADLRTALGRDPDGAGPPARPIERTYARSPLSGAADLERFRETVEDYAATVHVASDESEAATIVSGLVAGSSVVVPDDLPATYADVLDAMVDRRDAPLTSADLEGVQAVVTLGRLGIASTGTVVLDAGPGQGRRILTLLPDHHVVVLRADQVVDTVPQAFAVLEPSRPTTFISGPSATSDIELDRVEGVHGPRRLDVVLVH